MKTTTESKVTENILDIAALTEYQRVLMNDVDIALLAADHIKYYAESVEEDGIAKLWLAIHGFLVTTANLSKLLWPSARSTKFAKERGSQLRASLSIGEDSPQFSVLMSNKARNYFEHFDERLDTWVTQSKSRAIADFNPWGKSPDLSAVGENVTLFRNFDVETLSIIYGRETYRLKPIVEALWELYDRVRKAWFANMGIAPFPSNRKRPSYLVRTEK